MSGLSADGRKRTRRSFVLATAAGAAGGAAALSNAEGSSGEPDDGPPAASSLGHVTAVEGDRIEFVRQGGTRVVEGDVDDLAARFGAGVKDQARDSSHHVADAMQDWKTGHKLVVLETYKDDAWLIDHIERLYVPIEPSRVQSRSGSILDLAGGARLGVTPDTESRGSDDEQFDAVPISNIQEGHLVTGLGFDEADSDVVIAVALGTRR